MIHFKSFGENFDRFFFGGKCSFAWSLSWRAHDHKMYEESEKDWNGKCAKKRKRNLGHPAFSRNTTFPKVKRSFDEKVSIEHWIFYDTRDCTTREKSSFDHKADGLSPTNVIYSSTFNIKWINLIFQMDSLFRLQKSGMQILYVSSCYKWIVNKLSS